ncbi:MAG: hypothetical protein KF760_15390 [Candidatus Eremiobacteraeota bacterium]|nr:hypothetical protein [Candidatus Eremiobacteraeota bacterium]MCW5869503.1 hypothetical protein [Candidatus Eremiobacteraeota bacterium]
MRLENCLLASALLHAFIFLPGWARWFSPLTGSPPRPLPPLQVKLQPAPPPQPGQTRIHSVAPAPPGLPQARPSPGPAAVPRAPARPGAAAMIQPSLPNNPAPPQAQRGYPVHHPTKVRRQAAAPPSSEGFGELPLDPPAMLKGPQRIPIPAFLRNRDGHFLMTLRCRVEKDGSTRVEVMEGTGAPTLDEAVRQSFSGLPWYRAEVAGQPVAVTVRLVIEGSWESGQDSIDWGGRIPPMQ